VVLVWHWVDVLVFARPTCWQSAKMIIICAAAHFPGLQYERQLQIAAEAKRQEAAAKAEPKHH
jgi:hypothetical protein